MNVIDDFDYVATFDYPYDKTDNTDTVTEENKIYLWLDDLGWI